MDCHMYELYHNKVKWNLMDYSAYIIFRKPLSEDVYIPVRELGYEDVCETLM